MTVLVDRRDPGSVAERSVEGLREVGHEVVRILNANGVRMRLP